jgi:hypothetical protein
MKKIIIEKNDRKIGIRNYFIVLVVSVLTIALTLYVRSFIINYRNCAVSESIFSSEVQEINMVDIDYMIPETGECIILVSYTGNMKINSMENTLYKNIEKTSLKEKIVYLNVDDYLVDSEYIKILKNKFPSIESEINTAPLFIYVKNGEAIEAMSSELKLVDYKVFNKLVNKYEIE